MASLASRYKYTGQEEDEDTGLYYYKARYYDASVGRFVSADTTIPDEKNSQTYNRFMYVEGNPMKYSDPTGHLSVWWHVLITHTVVTIAKPYLIAKTAYSIYKSPLRWQNWTKMAALLCNVYSYYMAFEVASVDLGTQGTGHEDTRMHSMVGKGQSSDEADDDFWGYFENADNAHKLHAAQDRGTSSHYGHRWNNKVNWDPRNSHGKKWWNHLLGDNDPRSILLGTINSVLVVFNISRPISYPQFYKTHEPNLGKSKEKYPEPTKVNDILIFIIQGFSETEKSKSNSPLSLTCGL
jgi:RHS repeat-associated protein